MSACNKYLIGLDIGTSSVKGTAVCADGSIMYTEKSAFIYSRPSEDRVEISAKDFIDAFKVLFNRLMSQLPEGSVIAGLSAASASGNLLLIGKDGNPLTPIFNWQDKRTDGEPDIVLGKDFDTDSYYRSTGWRFGGKAFPLAQLCRIRVNEPSLLDECGMVCMSTEYLFYRLSGNWGIGTSAGTPFYLIDQESGKYRTDILEKLGIAESKLPPVMKTGSILGCVTKEASAEFGLPEGIPIVLGTFDHPSAARGAGIVREGQLLLSCGTSWVGFYPINDRKRILDAGMLCDPFLSEDGGAYAGMISVASISAKIEALTRRYIDSGSRIFDTLNKLAGECEPGAGGLRINPAEEPDDEIILKYPKKMIARAIMEGTVELLAERMERLAAFGIKASEAVMVGGPSERPLWVKLIAERTNMSVRVLHGAYAGAMGAAMLAGIAAGLFGDLSDAVAHLSKSE